MEYTFICIPELLNNFSNKTLVTWSLLWGGELTFPKYWIIFWELSTLPIYYMELGMPRFNEGGTGGDLEIFVF